MDRGSLRRLSLLLAELSLCSQHGDHPADADAARRSCGGVSLGGAAHGADAGTACRSAFVGGGRCPAGLRFRKSHRVYTGVLRRPLVALELIALLLLNRLPLAG